MKSKRRNLPRNSAPSISGSPPAPPVTASPTTTSTTLAEVPAPQFEPSKEAVAVAEPVKPEPETKPVPAPTPTVTPALAPAPLVSLAAALEAVHLDIPASVPPSATTELPVAKPVSAPTSLEKISESPKPGTSSTEPKAQVGRVTPCAPTSNPPENGAHGVTRPTLQPPTPAKISATVPERAPISPPPAATPVLPAAKKPASPEPKPAPAPEISEEQIVKTLPVMSQPEPKPAAEKRPPANTPDNTPATPVRTIAPMFVVMLTPELTPVAKVGGLGDVVGGLSRELELRGNAVEIILPKYDCMRYHHIHGLARAYENLQVPWFGGVIHTTVWSGKVHGRKCYFIDPHSQDKFFERGIYYGHNDDVMRFAFFCRAAMEFLFKTGKQPDIIHCHDWQTALAPVLLWEMYQHLGMRHPRVCFTIHNFKHQGVTGEHVLRATGLNRPEHFFHYDRMRDNNNPLALNLTKAGIVYSNFVTTVSPRHAWEAKDGGQAFGLEPTLNIHHCKYGGVLNGLDYDMFNPEKDPYIPSHFNAKTIEKKYENKRALRQRLWLADNGKPILAFIGRLDPQKGPELVRHAIFYALNHGAQFVLLGESPDKAINEHFWALKRHLNDSPDCHLEIGYSDELAHLIYAGADMMVVPSRFEPCGLTQLISLRYGTVPIVRSVGGLADTVFDKDHSTRPLHERNGYVFHDATDASMESALHRAFGCYYQFPEHFRHLMVNGMTSDYSWNHPGQHYLNIYDYIREK